MTPTAPRPLPYKDLTLQQMRSFVMTAQLGSLAGAARALELAQPTVWKQVQALQESFAAPLVQSHARGCRLTAQGKILDDLMRPLVAEIDALRRKYDEALGRRQSEIRIAATPRIIDEDLPNCIAAFQRRSPRIKLILRTAADQEVSSLVLAGDSELGYTERGPEPEDSPLSVETRYELDVLLLTPKNHPLARRRRIDLSALGRHPMVTSPTAIGDPRVNAQLHRSDAFATPASVEAFTAAGIRRYVRLGFGIGISGGLLTRDFQRLLASEGLAARSLGDVVGRIAIVCVRRKSGPYTEAHRAFDETIRQTMKRIPRPAR